MSTQQTTPQNFNWFNFFTIAIALITMVITGNGIEKNHSDVEKALKETEKSVELTRQQYILSLQQYQDTKKQLEDANKEAQEQRELQKKQFTNQLNEIRKFSNSSVKQINYQIVSQRPYLSTNLCGLIKNGNTDSFTVVETTRFCQ